MNMSLWGPDTEGEPPRPTSAPRRGRRAQAVKPTQSDSTARPESVAGITWSYSRRGVFEQCARRYYYEYFGAATRKALGDPDKVALRPLKTLANRHERAGAILHLGIATYFRRAQRADPMGADGLISWARSLLRRDIEYSAAHPDGAAAAPGPYPPVLLREYSYELPNADMLLMEAEERLVDTLQAFTDSPMFEAVRLSGMRLGALIEHHLRLPGLPCKVDGRLDLAFADAGQITVVDWKLGVGDGSGNDSLQLATYALWAVDHFGVPPESVRIAKAFLGSGEMVDFSVTARVLAAARIRIIQDAERMRALQAYGENGIAEAFTPCARPSVCASCPYQRVCPEGRSFLHA